MSNRPKVPAGLNARGRKFWRDTLAEFELGPSEVALLTEACRVMDRLDALDEDIRARGISAKGSQGQDVLNPSVSEARQQEVVLHRLLSALDIPDDEGQAALQAATSTRARTAANARWSKVAKVR